MLFAEHVENLTIGGSHHHWTTILVIVFAVFACILWLRFISQTKKANRAVDQMQKTIEEQQAKIEELNRELNELKHNR